MRVELLLVVVVGLAVLVVGDDGLSEAEAKEIFEKFDANKDGKMNIEELTSWLKADSLDRLHLMGEDEAAEVRSMTDDEYQQDAKDIIEEGDDNNDLLLDVDEFRRVHQPLPFGDEL